MAITFFGCIYLIMINVLTFIRFGIDKVKAKMHLWRISEKILLLFVVSGGCLGGWFGIFIFRHKTKDRSFLLPMILLTVSWIIGFIVFLMKLKMI